MLKVGGVPLLLISEESLCKRTHFALGQRFIALRCYSHSTITMSVDTKVELELSPHAAFALRKLKKDERYQHLQENDLVRRAKDLTDPEYMRCMFSYLFDSAGRLMWELAGEDGNELLNTMEVDASHKRAKQSAAQACHLPVRLLLSKLRVRMPTIFNRLSSLLSLEYGALHAALHVGQILIEWGREGIIDPQMEEYIPDREFQAQVHNQGEWHLRAQQLTKDMSIADRRHSSEEKIQVLYRSASEKHQLIENLIKVIIDYNGTREYSVFKCNCQHFVHDALVALGIKKTPQFSGRLSKYLKHLKVGIRSVPKDYDTHEKLDQYVKEHFETLTPHDMEYLLCHYFKHHLPEMEKDLDNWECTMATCQAENLEDRIKEHSLVFNQFRVERQDAIEEEDEEEEEDDSSSNDDEEFELPLEFAGINLKKQLSMLNKFSGYRENVSAKLSQHPSYDRTIEDTQIEFLSEREKFREQYLSSLIEGTSEEVVLQTSFDSEVSSGIPEDESKKRASERFQMIYNFPVKLLLRITANDVKSKKSKPVEEVPLKAALVVGDYVYEWDDTSLVYPKQLQDVVCSQPTLEINLSKQSEWFTIVSSHIEQINDAIETLDYDRIVQYTFHLTEKKDQLMYALVDEVVDYNRHYEYHKKNCNDKCFVKDVMKALGITKPFSIQSTLKRHTKELKPTKLKKVTSHQDLDMQLLEIDRNSGLSTLPRQDMDFLLTQYFLFHCKEWGVGCANPWACSVENCQLRFLERVCNRSNGFH